MLDAITSTTTPSDGIIPQSKAEKQKSEFLLLLVAQLKGQDPLNPMDGTEFVTQLAQFSSLEELINIREVMERVHATLQDQAEAADTEPAPIPFA